MRNIFPAIFAMSSSQQLVALGNTYSSIFRKVFIVTNIEQVKTHEQYHENSKQCERITSDDIEENKSSDNDESHLCNICNEEFRNKSHSYYTHIIKCVMRSKNFLQCNVCSSSFSSSENYEAHFENFPSHMKTF